MVETSGVRNRFIGKHCKEDGYENPRDTKLIGSPIGVERKGK
jgi:hypothetical protein